MQLLNARHICPFEFFTFYFQGGVVENLFVNYLSRVHREEDFHFILKGLTRLLNNPLIQVSHLEKTITNHHTQCSVDIKLLYIDHMPMLCTGWECGVIIFVVFQSG